VSESSVCLATLDKIFQSGCSATLQLTPCLCGSADAARCLAGTAGTTTGLPAGSPPDQAPNGPVLSIYQCELGTGPASIANNFTVQSLGAGQANALAQCAGAFGCDCF
jgi:hypothetical protein